MLEIQNMESGKPIAMGVVFGHFMDNTVYFLICFLALDMGMAMVIQDTIGTIITETIEIKKSRLKSRLFY